MERLFGNFAARGVYGFIAASNSKLDMGNTTSPLFVKADDGVEQGPNGMIPFSKSCAGVPLNFVLYMDISLDGFGVKGTSAQALWAAILKIQGNS